MRFFRRLSRRVGRTKAKMIVVAACAGFMALLLGAKIIAHKTPSDVKNPSLVLQAMKPAKCVGDLWGFDVYLARKNTELLSRAFPKVKIVIAGLFAEKVLQTAPWERTVDDLKYSFYVLRQEKIRHLNEATVFLITLKETLRAFGTQGEPLDPKETRILKSLREEESRSSPEAMETRCQELLWKSKSNDFKVRLLVRKAILEEQKAGIKGGGKAEAIKAYEKKEDLPFYLVLTAKELQRGPPFNRELLGDGEKKLLSREGKGVIKEYQKALEALSVRDYKGFIGQAEEMSSRYSQKDFAPLLLYQAWSVARYDLKDPLRERELLSRLKKEYPSSDWAYPDKAPKSLITSDTGKTGRGRYLELGKFLLPLNVFRGLFKETTRKVFLKIKEVNERLVLGETKELILDEKTAENYLEPFLPAFIQENLRGYQINLSAEGMDVFLGVKAGIFDVVLSGRGAVVVEERNGERKMRLRLREIRVQGAPVPRAFLRQIENDFEEAGENEALPMELVEATYWKGGAKVVLKKKTSQSFVEENAKAVSQSDLMEKKTDE